VIVWGWGVGEGGYARPVGSEDGSWNKLSDFEGEERLTVDPRLDWEQRWREGVGAVFQRAQTLCL
jgi:hypothetical protein